MKIHDFAWRGVGAFTVAVACALTLGYGPHSATSAIAQPAVTPLPPPLPGASAQLPPPSAPPPSALPTIGPVATPSPAPKGRKRGKATPAPGSSAPAPTASPTSPAYSTLDGGWEVQVQRIDGTTYSQFALHQDATTLSGTWMVDGKKYNVDGTYDGRFFRLNAKLPEGSYTLSGYVENSTDMVGIVDNGKGQIRFVNPIPFTAEHRAPHNKSAPVYNNKPPAGY